MQRIKIGSQCLIIYGLLSYVRLFVPRFVANTVALARLMQGGKPKLVWISKHHKIIKAILTKLLEYLGLWSPNFKQLFVLECELGKSSIGGVHFLK